MRYEKGHKETTRQHILDVASAQFRESGVAAVGLAGIMAAAGLTNGAFYTHFESKEDLVRAVLLRCARPARAAAARPIWKTMRGSRPPSATICRRGIATARAPAARPPRWSPRSRGIRSATRDAFTDKISEIIGLMAAQIGKGPPAERRKKAIAAYGMMVGSLQLARAVNDRKLSDEILENAADAALRLAGEA